MATILDYLLHVDVYLIQLLDVLGVWTYAVIFVTVFAEVGLVVFAFLPGESLLLGTGTLASLGMLNMAALAPMLLVAAFAGFVSNFLIGRVAGRRLLSRPRRYLDPVRVGEVHRFYERYGALTIVVSRFLPFIRVLAPFVAGVARMGARRLVFFAAVASVLWVGIFLGSGYWLGTADWARKYLALVFVAIFMVTALPGLGASVGGWMRHRRMNRTPR